MQSVIKKNERVYEIFCKVRECIEKERENCLLKKLAKSFS